MPALFVFLLKVNIALLLFCAGYYLVLRHLTFYTLNRIYLVSAILFASIYPKINLDGFVQRHQQLARPAQIIAYTFQAPAETLVKPLAKPDYWYWVEVVFWAGAAFLAIKLLMQLYSLYKMYRNSTPATIDEHKVRLINGDAGPFSFWQSIYINPSNHKKDDLKAILQHEQIHVNEWHTIDILLAELSTIFYWFNPGIWLMKKAVRENIEFITDRKILRNGIDTKQYQYSLVNVSFSAAPQNIVNHFNLSTIKKRIIMMNAKQSSKVTLTRYAFLVPVVLVCLLSFSISKAELIKKSKSAYKTISTSVSKINLVATVYHVNHDVTKMTTTLVNYITPTRDTAKLTAVRIVNFTDSGTRFKDTGIHIPRKILNFAFSTDTNPKKIITRLSAAGINEPITIIDGRMVKTEMLNSTSADNIDRIEIDKTPTNPRPVIYITTKTNNEPSQITHIRVNGQLRDMSKTTTINGLSALVDTIKVDKKPKMVNGRVLLDTIYLRRHPEEAIVRDYPMPKTPSSITFSPRTSSLYTKDALAATGKPNKIQAVTVTDFPLNRESSINNISDKLVIINGKEASVNDMKKLSAFDIDRMVLKNDEEIKSLYGDKAKNGVIFIITKKGK